MNQDSVVLYSEGAMFFRFKKSGQRTYIQIVENKRVDGAVRQSVIANLGRADELAASGALASLLATGANAPITITNSICAALIIIRLPRLHRTRAKTSNNALLWARDQDHERGRRSRRGHRSDSHVNRHRRSSHEPRKTSNKSPLEMREVHHAQYSSRRPAADRSVSA